LIFLLVFFYGCGGPYYYDLYLEPLKTNEKIRIDKILFVEDIVANEAYWTQRMVYRNSPFMVQYFTFKQWAKRPGEMIKDAIILFYKKNLFFNKVIEEYSSIEPDIILKTNIFALEIMKKDKQWFAHLALDIEVIEKKNEKMILSHSFDRLKKIRGRKARYAPEKISEILQEELLEVVKKLISKL